MAKLNMNIQLPKKKAAGGEGASPKGKPPKKSGLSFDKRKVMATLSRGETRRFVMIGAIVILGLLYMTQIKPALDNEKTFIDETSAALTANAKLETDIKALQAQSAQGGADADKVLAKALPRVITWDAQLDYLTALADRAGAKITAFNHQDGNGSATAASSKVALTMQCDYVPCLKFIKGIQSLARVDGSGKNERIVAVGPIWSVDTVNIGNGDRDLDMQLALTLYRAAGTSAAPSATGAATPPATETP